MRPRSFREHMAVLAMLVATLVCGLLYSISPGEVDKVFSAVQARADGVAAAILSHNDSTRRLHPDPFAPNHASQSSLWAAWLRQRQIRIAGLLLVAAVLLKLYIDRRRSRLAKAPRA